MFSSLLAMSGVKCLRSTLEGLMKMRISKGGFDANFGKVELLTAEEGAVKASLTVEPEHCNIGQVMHGGMASSLVDVISTMAVLTHNEDKPGVSIDLSVSFLSAAKLGSKIILSAQTLKRGKNIAFLAVDATDSSSGKLLFTGKHTKYLS